MTGFGPGIDMMAEGFHGDLACWPLGIGFRMLELEGKRVTVVGLARTGVAAASFLVRQGAQVTVTDVRPAEELAAEVARLPAGVSLALGGHPEEVFLTADVVLVSPGVPLGIPPILAAKSAGVRIISEIELAYQFISGPTVAVTGTNGKTTTTTLIARMLARGGRDVFVGGNIGRPLVEGLMINHRRDFWVAEISSFQLEAVDEFRPYVAVVLNVTPDHLDRYASFADYAAAKGRIFLRQEAGDFAVLNLMDGEVLRLAEGCRAQRVYFSRMATEAEAGGCDVATVKDGWVGLQLGGRWLRILPVEEVGLSGVHNLENVLAAIAVGNICGVEVEIMAEVVRGFRGLPHRLESLGCVRGVEFVNDSKATNVGAVVRSLEGFSQPVILIAGGLDKGASYRPLRRLLRERVKVCILLGQAADKMEAELAGTTCILRAQDMDEAVGLAFGRARPGEVVLLSPACASFDMFRDYEARGEAFRQAVARLRQD